MATATAPTSLVRLEWPAGPDCGAPRWIGPERDGVAGVQVRQVRGWRWVVGVQLGAPGPRRADVGYPERELLHPAVDQGQDVVVEQRRAVFGEVGVVAAVEVDGQGRALGSAQFSMVIGVAEGVNQASSAASIPTRKRRRRKTGWRAGTPAAAG